MHRVFQQLYVSEDLGKNWKLVKQFVNTHFFWAVKGVDSDDSVVHMEVQDPRMGEAQVMIR